MARVDIAVPCYNYGRFLRDCAESILSQSHKDLRVLIVDNASTDDSLAVARQIAAEDERVEIRAHAKNLGPHASYNSGLDWASGDYFFFSMPTIC
ncbi:MAG: glycosyltransferase family 2 protein [Rhodomicrobium sp.]|nr:glycosyltransferase family 2 protein [Rhodomicrobium sp.]